MLYLQYSDTTRLGLNCENLSFHYHVGILFRFGFPLGNDKKNQFYKICAYSVKHAQIRLRIQESCLDVDEDDVVLLLGAGVDALDGVPELLEPDHPDEAADGCHVGVVHAQHTEQRVHLQSKIKKKELYFYLIYWMILVKAIIQYNFIQILGSFVSDLP